VDQLELNLQQQTLGSLERGPLPDAVEQTSKTNVLRSVFYKLTDALLNISEGANGAVVDISSQANGIEAFKTRMGVKVLSTIDWLGQVARNLYEVNKPELFAKGGTGIMLGMGIPMLHAIDMYLNTDHALVIEDPQQEGVFPCDAAAASAAGLCTSGLEEAGQIGQCTDDLANPGRYQVNLYPGGELTITNLSPVGAFLSSTKTNCNAILGAPTQVEVPTSTTEAVISQPTETIPAMIPTQEMDGSIVECVGTFTQGSNGEAIEMLGVSTGRTESNPGGDINVLKASVKAICGVDISDDAAARFLQETTSPWIVDTYPVDASTFESWLTQHKTSEPTPQIPTAAPTSRVEVATASPDNTCVEPIRIEVPINLSEQDKLKFFGDEVLRQCDVELTTDEAELIMASRNSNQPENVHVISMDYIEAFRSTKNEWQDHKDGETYSTIGGYLAILAGVLTLGTLTYMAVKRIRFSDIFGPVDK